MVATLREYLWQLLHATGHKSTGRSESSVTGIEKNRSPRPEAACSEGERVMICDSVGGCRRRGSSPASVMLPCYGTSRILASQGISSVTVCVFWKSIVVMCLNVVALDRVGGVLRCSRPLTGCGSGGSRLRKL